MRPVKEKFTYYVGWDVGGWNCDKNPASRDALVILDSARALVGTPWRGNLRSLFNEASSAEILVSKIIELCRIEVDPDHSFRLLFAIDTPLGFSKAFATLVVSRMAAGPILSSSTNPYLHRETERFLFERGLSPLSPIKDMIGSQATKGIHFLACFAPELERCGVWTDGCHIHAIEAYPSACKRSASINAMRQPFYDEPDGAIPVGKPKARPELYHSDLEDALTCALIGWSFEHRPDLLVHPTPTIDPFEGWIYVPADGLRTLEGT
ncbi:hypothetical protein ALO83_102548 [Pseudomonas cannabina pv. alisalensis]|uniref:DUF429 domain-containing protein n=3 Tax=Pseudomonas syringae group TaxID=136849 RepID=A0A3M3S6A1_PSECA|nr:hypothetical protein ALO83_102548 [Pseudomonas cannabina pv. alisalensis]QHE99345.1 hypothetical protein PMA4326_023870 [Pseudomonas syringae pv. maculicola str. ES4326]RMN80789.1 hypothetical protein ALQ53_102431 [Pseudomonas cannabina]MBM0140900.1 hypothetical protein [Pseudomonas cannabina pv. alisalensis]QQN22636.1 hypothetical protein JGS08_02615 [Pseudomonas cannabina pv. alisalensis]